jgi:hypothetical protein
MAREILSKRNFFDFESPDSAISRVPMTLMKSMASLHQGPKISKAKPLNNGPSNKFIFRATYGNSIVCNIFPA